MRTTKGQRGQALSEYALLTAALIPILFFGWDLLGGDSIIAHFIRSFDIYLQSFHTVVALPIP